MKSFCNFFNLASSGLCMENADIFHLLGFNSVPVVVQLLSLVQLFAAPWTTTHQSSSPSLSPRVCSNSGPLSQVCHLTISSSVTPFSSCLQSFPGSGFLMSWLLASDGQSIEVSVFRTDFFQDGLVGSPCSPRDSQESSPTPLFKIINSSVLSFHNKLRR